MDWAVVLPLVDPVRRSLYELVRRRAAPVTRDEAAREVGISRRLAAFHLDKLVVAGLLRARYAVGRAPRGPGRTPKVYEPSGLEIHLAIPERRYDLLGEILLAAVAEEPADARQAALRLAWQRGEALGATVRTERRLRRSGSELALRAAAETLAGLGFEPVVTEGRVRLSNCPFHVLARQQTDLVCGIAQAFADGLLRGLGASTVAAVPRGAAEQGCCVQLVSHPTGMAAGRDSPEGTGSTPPG